MHALAAYQRYCSSVIQLCCLLQIQAGCVNRPIAVLIWMLSRELLLEGYSSRLDESAATTWSMPLLARGPTDIFEVSHHGGITTLHWINQSCPDVVANNYRVITIIIRSFGNKAIFIMIVGEELFWLYICLHLITFIYIILCTYFYYYYQRVLYN